MRNPIAVLSLILQAGCVVAGDHNAVQQLAEIRDKRIDEASGIVESRRNPAHYYIHNDSGDAPRVFVVDRAGVTRAVIRVRNAANRDWEDISIAPSATPDRFDVCVADIGDNGENRKELVIYRFPEPELPQASDGEIDVSATAFRFHYDGPPENAEAFSVHPVTGHAYILTKRIDGTSHVYRLAAPWNSQAVNTATLVTTLHLAQSGLLAPIVTGADISPDGRRLAVRTYAGGGLWTLPKSVPPTEFENVFTLQPRPLTLATEPQGEAIGWSLDGTHLLTVSEKTPTYLYETVIEP